MSLRFSGHETFPCRYTWLPKAFRAVSENPTIFTDEEQAMVVLGVGRNMVRSIRFWMQVSGIVEIGELQEYKPSLFGLELFQQDPYLEDIRTLWLIHWKFSTNIEDPLFAWDFMFNRWQQPEIVRTEILRAFRKEVNSLDRKLSDVTLAQHFDVFLHTYVPTRSPKGDIREDNLDCPLVELEIIHKIGESVLDVSGRREPVYAFRREAKPEITSELFIYCLNDYWSKRFPDELSLSFRDVAIAPSCPGQVFKLPEWDLRERLTTIGQDSKGLFHYQESVVLEQIFRQNPPNHISLASIYSTEDIHV